MIRRVPAAIDALAAFRLLDVLSRYAFVGGPGEDVTARDRASSTHPGR